MYIRIAYSNMAVVEVFKQYTSILSHDYGVDL